MDTACIMHDKVENMGRAQNDIAATTYYAADTWL
jgi:hypothetical protein